MTTYTRDNKEFRQYMADFARKLECCQTDKLFVDTFREAQARRDKRGKRVRLVTLKTAEIIDRETARVTTKRH
jgi:hypothetical protein